MPYTKKDFQEEGMRETLKTLGLIDRLAVLFYAVRVWARAHFTVSILAYVFFLALPVVTLAVTPEQAPLVEVLWAGWAILCVVGFVLLLSVHLRKNFRK